MAHHRTSRTYLGTGGTLPAGSIFLALLAVVTPMSAAQGTVYSGVVLAQGQPVAAAQVWLCWYRPTSEKNGLTEVQTDARGHFTVTGPVEEDAYPSALIARATDGRFGWLSLRGDEAIDRSSLRVALLPVGEARGRLTDAAGQPLRGVRVRIESLDVGPGKGPRRERQLGLPAGIAKFFEATTNADGDFAVPGIPVGASVYGPILALHPGDPHIGWDQSQPGSFRLETPGRVRIRFTGVADPKQLAGLPLLLFTLSRPPAGDGTMFVNALRKIEAKDIDTLEVDNVLPGKGALRFAADPKIPYVPKELPKVTVKPGEQTEVTLALEPAARVLGRVIDRDSQAGVAGVEVGIYSQGEGRQYLGHVSVRTGTDGRFMAYVHAGQISFQPHVPAGYAKTGSKRQSARPANVAGGAEHTFPDIVLEPEVRVEGVVVDEAGKPVANVSVRSTEEIPTAQRVPLVTDSKGKFALRNLGAGDVIGLRARTDQAVTDGVVLVNLDRRKGPVRLVLSRQATSRLRGQLADNGGRPIAGASVRVEWHYRGVGRHASAGYGSSLEVLRSGADGRFQSGVLWPGDDYRVSVTAEGYGNAESVQVQAKAGQVHDLGIITLTRTGGQVAGVVTDASGKPIPGVTVFNQGDAPARLATSTDSAGHFQLSGLYDGPVFLFAEKAGFRFTVVRVLPGSADARIPMRAAGEAAPAVEQPVRLKDHVAAEQKLLWHVLDKSLELSETATGGYKRLMYENLVRADQVKAKKWMDDQRARGTIEAKDSPRYVRTLRIGQAERLAASDADEAMTLLAELDPDPAFRVLLKMGARFEKTDPRRGLRFVEEAVVRARLLDAMDRAWALARAGDLVVRLGRKAAGMRLLAEAAGLAEEFGASGRQGAVRAWVARDMALYDRARARALLRPLAATESYNHWLSIIAARLARTDARAALALVGEMKEDRSTVRDVTRLQIARQATVHDPAEGARLAEAIADVRYRTEALVHVAVVVASRDRKLAWALIDKALDLYLANAEAFRSWRNYVGRSTFAAWTAGQAQIVGYPDLASAVARTLACRPSLQDAHSPAHALETQVRMAKVLALVDPVVARQMLEAVIPQQALLGSGYSGFERQDWLLARCLADPVGGLALVDEAIAKLDPRQEMAFYHCGVLQLAELLTATPEQRVRAAMGLNSGLVHNDEE